MQTVAALVVVIGVVLLANACRRRAVPEVALLAMGSAAALAAVDIIFVSRQVIDPIYLLDAVVEGVLLLWWLTALAAQRRGG